MSLDRASKVVLITGASSGIGESMARLAAAKGYRLALTARRADRLDRFAAEFEATGSEVFVIPAALEDPDAPERIIAAVLARFGRLDVLINNAGFGLPTLFANAEPVAIRRQVEVNLAAPMLLARHALPALIERRGVIINVGSAITCIPNSGLGAYGATKAGLAYWSLALRRELKHQGVQVCLVEPGPVRTEFFDAVTRLGPEPGRYHPMLDAPSWLMSIPAAAAAARIVALIERPRRLLSVPRRFVWPWRLIGGFFQLWPSLADLVVSTIVHIYDGRSPRTVDPARGESHAAKAE